jgi:hypothetical protein
MFIKKLLILILVLSLNPRASFSHEGGSTVGNGGGVSENNLIEAWNRLPYYFEQIINAKGLNLSSSELSQIKGISSRFKSEQKTGLKFYTEAQFQFNGQSFMTNKQIGSVINFNLDKLFILSQTNEKVPYTLGNSVGLFVRILSRNDLILSSGMMTKLELKINDFFTQVTGVVTLAYLKRPEIQMSVINWEKDNAEASEIHLMDSTGVIDLTEAINAAIPCAGKKKLTKILSLSLYPPQGIDEVSNEQKLIFQSNIEFSCTVNDKVSNGAGGLILRTFLLLKSIEPSAPVDNNWWTSNYVFGKFNEVKLNISFSDIHFN